MAGPGSPGGGGGHIGSRYAAGRHSRTVIAGHSPCSHAPRMFVVSEAEAAAIRSAFDRGGELSAAVELRRLFPGITDNVQARECARIIAGWKPIRRLRAG